MQVNRTSILVDAPKYLKELKDKVEAAAAAADDSSTTSSNSNSSAMAATVQHIYMCSSLLPLPQMEFIHKYI
jgi:hypothetical protein